jgi:hypothetical protein
LETELAAIEPPTNVVTLHPVAVKRYLEMVDDLATSLPHREITSDGSIAAAMREFIARVTITPTEKGPPTVEVMGRLSVLIGGDTRITISEGLP